MQTLNQYSLDELYIFKRVIENDILNITDPKDFNIKVVRHYIDDGYCCANAIINNVPMEFLWYEQLGFLIYYTDSVRAFNDLKKAIQNTLEMIGHIINDKEHEDGITN